MISPADAIGTPFGMLYPTADEPEPPSGDSLLLGDGVSLLLLGNGTDNLLLG